jgi:hypothetical protein
MAPDGQRYRTNGANGLALGDIIVVEYYSSRQALVVGKGKGSPDWIKCNAKDKVGAMTIAQSSLMKASAKVKGNASGAGVPVSGSVGASHSSESSDELQVGVRGIYDVSMVQYRINMPITNDDDAARKRVLDRFKEKESDWKANNVWTMGIGIVTNLMVLQADSSSSTKTSSSVNVSAETNIAPVSGGGTASMSGSSSTSVAKGTVIGVVVSTIEMDKNGHMALVDTPVRGICHPLMQSDTLSDMMATTFKEECTANVEKECKKAFRRPCQQGTSIACGDCLEGFLEKKEWSMFGGGKVTCEADECSPGYVKKAELCECPDGGVEVGMGSGRFECYTKEEVAKEKQDKAAQQMADCPVLDGEVATGKSKEQSIPQSTSNAKGSGTTGDTGDSASSGQSVTAGTVSEKEIEVADTNAIEKILKDVLKGGLGTLTG